MKKFKKRISNPMTIIAIFAALSETSAAVSMPFLDNNEREIYVWFLISFPFYLLFLFFLTLNFNYRSLYAPSDFNKGKHFLKVIDNAERPNNKVQSPAVNLSRIFKNSIATSASERAPPIQVKSVRYRRWNAQGWTNHFNLQRPQEELRIIDTRGIVTNEDCTRLIERVRKPSRQPTYVIVFLACSDSEKLLREGMLKYPRHKKKGAAETTYIVYNLNSRCVTVLDKA